MRFALLASVLIVLLSRPGTLSAQETVITVFDSARIEHDPELTDGTQRDGYVVSNSGRTIETAIRLPAAPQNHRDDQHIVATVTVKSVSAEKHGPKRPGDEWTRLGSVTLLLPSPGETTTTEVELMRFTTGFGGQGTFHQDLTALAPLLSGAKTLQLFISTFQKPAWEVSLTLTYSSRGVGYRRPVYAQPLFNDPLVTAQRPRLRTSVRIPDGLARPRLRILTTGHATDGIGGDEFISRTHLLRIDGEEIARWRPWCESGGTLRPLNPTSGRKRIDGRELWSSDLDRSGWHPGMVVQPLVIPVPELTAGRHEIELEIIKIRQEDESNARGYWRVSAVIVADEPWPGTEQGGDPTPTQP